MSPRRPRSLVLGPLLGIALGCASPARGPDSCPRSIDEVLGSPALLREQADAALADDAPELAYRYLALIETLHPESAESRELFPAAVKLFKAAYFGNRVRHPDSVWTTSEPAFMFHWLSSFFHDQEVFPQEQVDALFLHMPASFFQEFTVYAKQRPKYFARWDIRMTEDDGRIETITATRALRPGRDISGTSR